ncbi:MAG TPA: phosphatase, partial [Candidatus Sulfotelmatobacter sp.]
MPKSSAQNRARKIKLLLFDVDGVLTDGKLFFIPRAAPAENGSQSNISQANGAPLDLPASSPQMLEFKGFHAHDGVAISLARLGGIRTGLITKRVSETVALRARDL